MKDKFREILPQIIRGTYLGSILSLLIFLTMSVVNYADAFKIFEFDELKIVGNETVSSDELFRLSGLKFGENLLDIDVRRAAERIAANPFIERVSISRDLPHTVAMRVMERKPFVLISQGRFYAVDKAGHLLPSRSHKNFDLPIITGIEELSLPYMGNKVDDLRFGKALDVALLLNAEPFSLYNSISEINISPRGDVSLIGTLKGTKIFLGRSGYENKINRIRSLLSTLKQGKGLSGYHYVDLRFENQVIVKERS